MTIIAVAGGTGGVGKTIVETLLQEPKHQIIILSRNEPKEEKEEEKEKEDGTLPKAPHVQIDYSNISALTQTLEQHAIHTIISAITIFDDENSQAQLNLIQAADNATTTKRFIPSEYSFVQTEDLLPIDPSIKYWLSAAKALQTSNLQYTRIIPGFFMDYWGMPHARSHLSPHVFGIDIPNGRAAIPGDGNDTLCMTYTYDMAAFLVRILELQVWEEFSVVVGDEVTYNQLLGIVEGVTGRKFEVVYDSIEKVKKGEVTVPAIPDGYSEEEAREMTALVSRLTISGAFDLPQERLNGRFPDLKPIKVREFLDVWRGKS
ncbi:nmrA-like family protein [Aspergillus heteromorphus CBS 117.55]|uniref:NmrA-like family protein n=1 Tax=Aspergillus heteromorphus CBS 117.55 TaxID=1448321 RepID=A0A317VJ16_9EURO|nr:nmrA-like family protein [Aspergillus heteromorphus CBS 117.55]PWY74336.1 nmrA-like family protein [Aspergillus heteromorphus CBS 117.55]